MPSNNDETPNKKTLRERTQSFRNKARRLIRMNLINEILQRIFKVNKNLSRTTKDIERLTKEETSAEKITARAEYKMSNLNPEDPDFDEKQIKAVAFVETEKIRQESTLKQLNTNIKSSEKEITHYTKQIENLDKEIEAIESGETKVSIDEVNDLADSLINKS